jgi:hypothetical protein
MRRPEFEFPEFEFPTDTTPLITLNAFTSLVGDEMNRVEMAADDER